MIKKRDWRPIVIWKAERSPTSRRRSLVIWTIILSVVLVLYPLSLGPVCYLGRTTKSPAIFNATVAFYMPMLYVRMALPDGVMDWYDEYLDYWWQLGAPPMPPFNPPVPSDNPPEISN